MYGWLQGLQIPQPYGLLPMWIFDDFMIELRFINVGYLQDELLIWVGKIVIGQVILYGISNMSGIFLEIARGLSRSCGSPRGRNSVF